MNTTTDKPQPPTPAKPPAGFEEVQNVDSIVGFVDPHETPVTLIPRAAKLMDNTAERTKSATLVICELCQDALVTTKEGRIPASKGDLVGLWYKPGMRPIKNYAGVELWIAGDGERDIGKPSPMKVYKILARKGAKGSKLQVIDDIRRQSKQADVDDDDSYVPPF